MTNNLYVLVKFGPFHANDIATARGKLLSPSPWNHREKRCISKVLTRSKLINHMCLLLIATN